MGSRWGTVETVTDFILGGSKITVDGNCSHEIKRHLLLGRKVMANLESIKTAKKTQMCITNFWTQRERERVG